MKCTFDAAQISLFGHGVGVQVTSYIECISPRKRQSLILQKNRSAPSHERIRC